MDYSVDFPDDISELVGGENAPLSYGSALLTVVIPELSTDAQANLRYDEPTHRGVDLT